jgi:hypothetical protein
MTKMKRSRTMLVELFWTATIVMGVAMNGREVRADMAACNASNAACVAGCNGNVSIYDPNYQSIMHRFWGCLLKCNAEGRRCGNANAGASTAKAASRNQETKQIALPAHDRKSVPAIPVEESKQVNVRKSVRPESSRDAGACSDAMTNCGGNSESMPPPGPAQIPWGFRNQSPYKGCTTLAPCSQPQLPPPGIDLAEAKRIDEIRLQQYSNVYRDEKLFWQAVQAILEGLSAEPPDFGSAIEKAAEDYQAQEIKRAMPDYMTDEEVVDAAIDELAANRLGLAIKNDPTTQQPAPNAQELWNKIENALTVQDAPAASSLPQGQSAFPPLN